MSRWPLRDDLGSFWRLYRVGDWLHFLPLPLAGWITSHRGDLRSLAGGVVAWGLALAYTSAINQAFDERVDRANKGKNPVGGRFDRRQAIALAIPPAIACLAVSLALAPAGLPAAIVMLVAATLYSAPPRLKRIPVVGTLWNLVVGSPGLFFADQPDVSRLPLRLHVGLFALLLIVSQLIHEAEDREDDRAGGVGTVATAWGVRGALGAAACGLLAMPGVTWWLAAGLRERVAITIMAGAFAAAWTVALGARLLRDDGSALRRVRLRYRYAAIALGALVFAAAMR